MKGPISGAALRELYQGKSASPVEVLDAALKAKALTDAEAIPLAAFVTLTPERARRAAEASAARWKKGEPLGPLDGLPIAIKDMLDMAGLPTTDGCAWRQAPATSDSPLIERLEAAGAVIIGKTSLHEIGLGGTGLNPGHITARNPADPRHMTGGSSSGSGAAVGAGIVPIALGSDAGGSIRIPAGFCGVYGLKATYGRVPAAGAALLCQSLDHIGPLGSTLEDIALAYDAIAGPHPGDDASLGQPAPTPSYPLKAPSLSSLRVAYDPAYGQEADPEVADAFAQAIEALRAGGAQVDAVSIEGLSLAQKVGYLTLGAEAATSQRPYLKDHRQDYGLDTRLLLAMAGRITAVEYLHAQAVRGQLRRRMGALLGRYDLFLSPTTACVAPPIHPDALAMGEVDPHNNDRIARYSFLANITGFPALSLPWGANAEGLPFSLMAMSRPWSEARLIAWGAAINPLAPPLPPPRLGVDLLDLL